MNRLCIYVTYSKDCIIKEYVGYMVKALRECCTTVCLVCNYPEAVDGLQYVRPYVDEIYYRQNIGFDAGAYKDALLDYIGWKQVETYDELVLANDSFFGPFYPLQDFFEMMSSKDCDFWGMSGSTSGDIAGVIYNYDTYVHSYFFAFRSQVLHSEVFRDFWNKIDYPLSFNDAIVNYEYGINKCLKEHGFKGISHADCWNVDMKKNENPYTLYPVEMIEKKAFPILKKKNILIRNPGFENALKAIRYLQEHTLYNTEWITEVLENQFYLSENCTCNSLEKFYNTYSDIYIYGKGVCGSNLAAFFDYKGWTFNGFILTDISEDEINEQNVHPLGEVDIKKDTGIIISILKPEIANEIVDIIGNRCHTEQLFLISECVAIKLPD